MKRFKFQTVLLILLVAATAFGDTIYLRDGRRIDGVFVTGSTANGITFRDNQGVRHRFSLRDVESMEFGSSTQARNVARNASGADIVIPEGSELRIRTNERIDSTVASPGRRFDAVVEEDVRDRSGAVAIPRGSPAELVIVRLEEATTTTAADLVLDINSVTVGGRRYLVSTEELKRSRREGIGVNRRTGEYVGGGAALGALIGAIAGGGKGAAIGAAVGAGAGAGTQILTRGKEVQVPEETILRFQIDRELYLDRAR